jgi:hypothetical protein
MGGLQVRGYDKFAGEGRKASGADESFLEK